MGILFATENRNRKSSIALKWLTFYNQDLDFRKSVPGINACEPCEGAFNNRAAEENAMLRFEGVLVQIVIGERRSDYFPFG